MLLLRSPHLSQWRDHVSKNIFLQLGKLSIICDWRRNLTIKYTVTMSDELSWSLKNQCQPRKVTSGFSPGTSVSSHPIAPIATGVPTSALIWCGNHLIVIVVNIKFKHASSFCYTHCLLKMDTIKKHMVCDTMDMLYVISIFHWSGGSKRQRRDFTQSKWRHRQARETTLLHWPAHGLPASGRMSWVWMLASEYCWFHLHSSNFR